MTALRLRPAAFRHFHWLCIGIEQVWTDTDIIVRSFYMCLSPVPWRWEIRRYHGYYDGPNCIWTFGPVSVQRRGFDCTECEGDE